MVNFGFNGGSLLGCLDVILAIAYLAWSIFVVIARGREFGTVFVFLFVIQALIALGTLILSGLILIFQGWRLDPILQLGYFLLNILIIYVGLKDVILLSLVAPRNQRSIRS
jgi:hypothetical protein